MAEALDFSLLSRPGPAGTPPPELDSSDSRMGRFEDLLSRGQYVEAAQAADALFRAGFQDVRLLGGYLYGAFSNASLAAMPVIFSSVATTLTANWSAFGPTEKKPVHADKSLFWLFRMLNRTLGQHDKLRDSVWRDYLAPYNQKPVAEALAQAGAVTAALRAALGDKGTAEGQFQQLANWLDILARAFEKERATEEPGAQPDADPEPPAPAPMLARQPSVPSQPPAPGERAVPVSPALALLMRKLEAFEALIKHRDFIKASVIAADVLGTIEHFDPRTYLPTLFTGFYSGLSAHASVIEPLVGGGESLAVKALDQLYRIDLEAFLALETGAEVEMGE